MWLEKARERWMNFYHVYLVALAMRACKNALRDPEQLRGASEGAGRDLAGYMRLLGQEARSLEDAIDLLNASLGLSDRVLVSTRDSVLEVRVHEPSCRLCLDSPNADEGEGVMCMLSGLLKGFVEGMTGTTLEYGNPELERDGEWLVLRYRIEKTAAA